MFKTLLGFVAGLLVGYEVIAIAIGLGMVKAAIRTRTAIKVTFPVWPGVVGLIATVCWILL